jgi:hypothetical protein
MYVASVARCIMHSAYYIMHFGEVFVEFYHNRAVVYPQDGETESFTVWLWDDEEDLLDQIDTLYQQLTKEGN